jgi:glycosyltransferase involved in cell wall biosynthesis
VITTALPTGVRELSLPGVTGLEVPIRDVEAMSRALETLGRDPELRERMGPPVASGSRSSSPAPSWPNATSRCMTGYVPRGVNKCIPT